MSNNEQLQSLLDMGYEESKAREALKVHPDNLEQAVEYLVNTEEADATKEKKDPNAVRVAKSYICTDTGKVFRTMRDAELYAEKTGYTNFEESDIEVPPLSEEEKKAKIQQLREKIKAKKAEREAQEKIEDRQREITRRKEGQEMVEVREKLEKRKRMNEFAQIRREKEEDERRRQKLREEIAQDKGNRAADKAEKEGRDVKAAYREAYDAYMNHINKPAAEKSPEEKLDLVLSAIDVVDGRKTILETLNKMLSNIVKDPSNNKFRKIKIGNPAFQKRIGKYRSGMAFFKRLGFIEVEEGGEKYLVLSETDLNLDLIKVGISKVSNALGI